jgi:MFS family permease
MPRHQHHHETVSHHQAHAAAFVPQHLHPAEHLLDEAAAAINSRNAHGHYPLLPSQDASHNDYYQRLNSPPSSVNSAASYSVFSPAEERRIIPIEKITVGSPVTSSPREVDDEALSEGSRLIKKGDIEEDYDDAPAYEEGEEEFEEEVEEEEKEFVITSVMKMTVIACSLLMLVITLPATLIYSFLPHEATSHGSSETTVGFVFSSYSFAVFIAAFFGGKIATYISAERMILYGGFINAVSTTVFAFALSFSGSSFVSFCIAMRFFQGIGASFVEIGINVLVTYQFQENPAIALCWVDLCSGLACVFGPALGGLMYDLGGFKLPFLVTGIATAAMITGLVFVLPEKDVQEEEHKEDVHMGQVLKIPMVPVLLFLCIVSLMTSGFLDATLETHLETFNLRPALVGSIISLLGLSYSIAAPIVAWLLGRVGNLVCFYAGAIMAIIGLLLLGPAPFLPISPTIFVQVCGVLLVGFGTSFIGTPILPSVLEYTRFLGEGAREIIVGTAICSYSIGDILGPVVGTFLLDHFSFQFAALFVALCILVALVIDSIGSLVLPKPVVVEAPEEEEGLLEDENSYTQSELSVPLIQAEDNEIDVN